MNGFLLILPLAIILYGTIAYIRSESSNSGSSPYSEGSDDPSLISAVDVRGKVVTLPSPAKRIVVLYQASLDGLHMLGAENAVVGIQHNIYTNPKTYTYFSRLDQRIASRELPTPGNWENSTNMESLVSLSPDLVIMASGQTTAIKLLESLGIPVFAVSPSNNQQLFQELLSLGILTGTEERAKELLDFTQSKLREIRKKTSKIKNKKKGYYAWSGGRIFSTSGRNSRMHECFELAGVENACPFDLDTPNINPESLISWDPDIFLLWNSSPEDLYNAKELGAMRAVRGKNVHVFEPAFFYDPHTLKIMYMALELHEVAYGDNPDMDLEAYRKEIMTGLYGEKANRLFQ
jgi:iron complex transport system substrate-binding protein